MPRGVSRGRRSHRLKLLVKKPYQPEHCAMLCCLGIVALDS
jgi:hypothetical protein